MTDHYSFTPAWWLNNGHLQTLFPALCRSAPSIQTVRERLPTADGDFVDIDYYGKSGWPLVILLHGLTGSSASIYIKGMQAALHSHGWRSATLNFRGCSGAANLTSRCYHSGETGDLDLLYHSLHKRHPGLPIAAIGFSLGGNVLLKWLGERGGDIGLCAAAAVSVPLRLDLCATRLDSGFSKQYRNRMLQELKAYMRFKHRHLLAIGKREEAEKIANLGDLGQLHSFWEYDQQVIARLYGFDGVADYYRRSSARQFLKDIRIPTLLIQAADDPFMTAEVQPRTDELADCIRFEVTRGGGHVGFISGNNPLRPEYWLERRIPVFLRSYLD